MQCALTPDFIPPDLWCLNSPADYSFWSIMQEKVYQTHSEYRWAVETSTSSGVGTGQSWITDIIAAAIGQRRRRLNACDSSLVC